MNISRLFQILRLWTIPGALKRAEYIKKKRIFAEFGNECSYMNRNIPLYAKLIKVGNNVHFASHVTFITHDVAHMMINRMQIQGPKVREKVGCIEIGNNVFIGMNTIICRNVSIGDNVILGAGSVVTKNCESNSVYAGNPAKRIRSLNDFIDKRKAVQKEEAMLLVKEYKKRLSRRRRDGPGFKGNKPAVSQE